MATNRNFIVKQGIQVGGNATCGSTWSSNNFISNKNDLLSEALFNFDFSKGAIDPRIQTIRSDVSRASTVAANGKIVIVSNNTPRVIYNLDTGLCDGLLSEESRTNTQPYSDIEGPVGTVPLGMNTAGGSDQRPLVSTDVWIGPNKQSCKHTRGPVADNNVGYMGTFTGTGLTSTTFTFSVYLYIPSNTTITTCTMQFESATLTLSPNPTASANLSIRDRWQRISGTCIVTGGSGTAAPVLRIDPVGAVVYSDCWQIERGEYASSWIPTLGASSSTRGEEQHYIDIKPGQLTKEFSFFIEAAPLWFSNSTLLAANNSAGVAGSAGGTRGLFGLYSTAAPVTQFGSPIFYGYGVVTGSSGNYSLSLGSRQYNVNTPLQANSGTATDLYLTQAGYDANTYRPNNYIKIAGGANTTTSKITLGYSNNLIITTQDPAGGQTIYFNQFENPNHQLDRILIGWQYRGGVPNHQWGGMIKKFVVFPRMLSNIEFQSLVEYT
jgi:hypothetical protein